MQRKRIVVGMTGASGAILGIRLLQELRRADVETHLICSDWAARTIELETDTTFEAVCALADAVYANQDLAATVSSGSFHTDGMVVIPCSMKSLAAIANGFSCNLIARAADVTLKERRKLLLVPRETPLSSIHLRNMLSLSQDGTIILPPSIAFYSRPETLEDAVNHMVGKVLDMLEIPHALYTPWRTPDEQARR